VAFPLSKQKTSNTMVPLPKFCPPAKYSGAGFSAEPIVGWHF